LLQYLRLRSAIFGDERNGGLGHEKLLTALDASDCNGSRRYYGVFSHDVNVWRRGAQASAQRGRWLNHFNPADAACLPVPLQRIPISAESVSDRIRKYFRIRFCWIFRPLVTAVV
jgi:hypothetical protein